MNIKIKALFALLGTVFLWSFMVVLARGVILEVHPMSLLFARLLVASIFFLPFFIARKPWRNKSFPKLAIVSLLSSINLTFFILGIQYTSASVSQLIYAAIPILILLVGTIFLKEIYPLRKILGVLIGLIGIIFIVYLSVIEKGTTITGTLIGNLLLVIAMFGWMGYILAAKKLSKSFSPIEIGSVSIIVSFIVSIPLLLMEIIILRSSFYLPERGVLAAFYMGFLGTFLTYLLYQYAIRHASALTVSLASYIQPVTTTILAIIFLGETPTIGFLFGSLLVFFGVFLATTLEVLHRRSKISVSL